MTCFSLHHKHIKLHKVVFFWLWFFSVFLRQLCLYSKSCICNRRLRGWGRGEYDASGLSTRICYNSDSETELDDDENETCRKLNFEIFSSAGFESQKSPSHCSNCGHPGTKRDHAMYRCSACRMDENTVEAAEHGCVKKGKGFQCLCMACAKVSKKLLLLF
jgi:hypothetical protein